MKKQLRNLLYGFLSWLIPFVSAFFFYSPEGELTVDIFLFKTIMIIVGASSGAFLIVLYFKKVSEGYLKEGIIIGVTWLLINIVLDILVLIPISGMAYGDYFAQIGLRYSVIPVMSIMVGLAVSNASKSQ